MNMKVACPHCQVVGVVPENLKYASDWPVACHHCHQHYFLPVVASPAPLSRQIELNCADCGRQTTFDKNIHESIVTGNFPLFCPDCHAPLTEQQNDIIELGQTETNYSDAKQTVGASSGIAFVFMGFFIVSVSVMAAYEGLIDRAWLDALMLHLPDHAVVHSYLSDMLKSSS